MSNNLNYSDYNIDDKGTKIVFLIFAISVFVLIIYFLVYTMKKENARGERILKSWQLRMARNGIKTLNFKLERKEYLTGNRGNAWIKLKRLYINGKIASPDTLYNRSQILYKHCNGDYYFYGYEGVDSVIWEFPPVNRYIYYNSKLDKFSGAVAYSHSGKHNQYKNKLPQCWDK